MLRPGYFFVLLLSAFRLDAQAPASPDRPWIVTGASALSPELSRIPTRAAELDPHRTYTLPDLVDIAEQNNPTTRIAWQAAKQSAASLGIARSALFPTLAAVASASVNQYSLFNGKFNHEDTALLPDSLSLTYTVLDFGARGARVDAAKANLLAANFNFNNTHRNVVFQVAQSYYRLTEALSQQDAAKAALADAQTVRDAVELRLANGLATLPDALEARAVVAEAQYELSSIEGLVDTARGDLATALGVSPATPYTVLNAGSLSIPKTMTEPVQAILDRSLRQRPDLLEQAARLRSDDASLREAHSAFDPVLSVSGNWGHSIGFGQQRGGPEVRSAIYPYQLQLNLTWTIFDGGARKYAQDRARSSQSQTVAQMASERDQIENQVWTAYTHLATANQQLAAAEALLPAADQSYSAALEAFQSGVRTFIDVSSAQKALARARANLLVARVHVLAGMAELAFASADPIPGTQH